jgi:hypothetical protein
MSNDPIDDHVDANARPSNDPVPAPRWVKVAVAISIAVALLIIMMLISGHGPGRHMGTHGGAGLPPSSSMPIVIMASP